MLYAWVKTVVGVLVTVNFSVILVTVLSNRHLWEEPMAVLAGNTSLISTLFGIWLTVIGLYDVIELQSTRLCQFLQYSCFGVGIGFKATQVCAAIDQFVAVIYPLRYYPIMMRIIRWLFVFTWSTWATQISVGLDDYYLDMDTFSEHIAKLGGNPNFTGCRWETALANAYTIFVEVEMIRFSLVTASLLICTGVIGHRFKKRLLIMSRPLHLNGTDGGGGNNRTFLENYRAFKKIMAVLSLTVTLDIVAPTLRISSRWYPQPTLNGLLHQARLFGFIFEGWAYGLLNKKLRAAYRKMLCGRFHRVNGMDTAPKPVPVEGPKESPPSRRRSGEGEGHQDQPASAPKEERLEESSSTGTKSEGEVQEMGVMASPRPELEEELKKPSSTVTKTEGEEEQEMDVLASPRPELEEPKKASSTVSELEENEVCEVDHRTSSELPPVE